MILISHRGNTKGPDINAENNPSHIKDLVKTYNCEIDLWFRENTFFLGHDYPQYKINEDFLFNDGLWIHAKNLNALDFLTYTNLNYFWHQQDNFTLTSNRYIWTYPNYPVTNKSIIIDNNKNWVNKKYNCYGICTDWILM
mgnify:CR=1 FL=1